MVGLAQAHEQQKGKRRLYQLCCTSHEEAYQHVQDDVSWIVMRTGAVYKTISLARLGRPKGYEHTDNKTRFEAIRQEFKKNNTRGVL